MAVISRERPSDLTDSLCYFYWEREPGCRDGPAGNERATRRRVTHAVARALARKVPPPVGRVTGRKSGAGDRWLWNSNDTSRPDRWGARTQP